MGMDQIRNTHTLQYTCTPCLEAGIKECKSEQRFFLPSFCRATVNCSAHGAEALFKGICQDEKSVHAYGPAVR